MGIADGSPVHHLFQDYPERRKPWRSHPIFHLTDEIDCIRTARMLSFRDCKILYAFIRHAVTEKARFAVADFIKTHYHKHVLL